MFPEVGLIVWWRSDSGGANTPPPLKIVLPFQPGGGVTSLNYEEGAK